MPRSLIPIFAFSPGSACFISEKHHRQTSGIDEWHIGRLRPAGLPAGWHSTPWPTVWSRLESACVDLYLSERVRKGLWPEKVRNFSTLAWKQPTWTGHARAAPSILHSFTSKRPTDSHSFPRSKAFAFRLPREFGTTWLRRALSRTTALAHLWQSRLTSFVLISLFLFGD